MSFGIDVQTDIVTLTGDGAPVMTKFGRLLKIPYLLCINHTIHLAVMDEIFTEKVVDVGIVQDAIAIEEEEPNLDHSDDENETDSDDESESSSSDDDSDSDYEPEQSKATVTYEANRSYQDTINLMRKIIKSFRLSALKTGFLEETMRKDGLKPLKLTLDVPTRWNSLVVSGKRFLNVLPSTLKVLKTKSKSFKEKFLWADHNTEVLKEITEVLEPARVATEKLSDAKINILVGEGCLQFVIEEIQQYIKAHPESYLAKNFLDALNARLKVRRNKVIIGLIMFLNNPDSLKDHPLELGTKTEIVQLGIDFARRLFPNEGQDRPTESISSPSSSSTLHERLNMSLGKLQSTATQPEERNDNYKNAFDNYDRTKVRGPLLDKLFHALQSAQPTSTQSERNFSLAATVVTPERSRISTQKMNATCFLKGYFQNQQ